MRTLRVSIEGRDNAIGLWRSGSLDMFGGGRKCLILCALALVAGCATAQPPQATVAEIEPSGRVAKGPDCAMPVLRSDPLTDFKKVSVISGLGNGSTEESDVMPAVKRAACAVGADALEVEVSETSMESSAYYIIADAIIYVQPAATPAPATQGAETSKQSETSSAWEVSCGVDEMTDEKSCTLRAQFSIEFPSASCEVSVKSHETVGVICAGDDFLDSTEVRVDKFQALPAALCVPVAGGTIASSVCAFASGDERRLMRELSKGRSLVVRITLSNLTSYDTTISLKDYGPALRHFREESRQDSRVREVEPQER